MITTLPAFQRALRGSKPTFAGVILYEGPSMLDGRPIVVIACRIEAASSNAKTGAMVQTFIIRSDISPTDALRTGDDVSVCGQCPHRPAVNGTCYVNVGRSVRSVFEAYQRGRYARPGIDYDPAILPELFRDAIFRLGSYGDPAAAPLPIWQHATQYVKARNGYTHQWRRFPLFKSLCMASADSVADAEEAQSRGWRTFRVRHVAETLQPREVMCPASKEAGVRTTCADCRACGGTSAKAKASIAIIAHGSTAGRFAA